MKKTAFLGFALSLSALATTEFDFNQLAPAQVLGKFEDKANIVTHFSWIVSTEAGIAMIREPRKDQKDLFSAHFWGKCRAVLPMKDAARFVDSGFCLAVRHPEMDQPEKDLEAYTFGDPETAAADYRANVVRTLVTSLPLVTGTSTYTLMLPKDLSRIQSDGVGLIKKSFRGTVNNPKVVEFKLKMVDN